MPTFALPNSRVASVCSARPMLAASKQVRSLVIIETFGVALA
jgi:hypothetical protein